MDKAWRKILAMKPDDVLKEHSVLAGRIISSDGFPGLPEDVKNLVRLVIYQEGLLCVGVLPTTWITAAKAKESESP